MKNNDNAIEINNISKTFKMTYDKPQTLKERLVFWHNNNTELFHVLNDIDFSIKKGETVALIGTNGSGKSTLLKLMTKIIYPNKGTIETNGKLTSLLELGAGFHPDFTGRENIYFNAAIFGLNRSEIDARVNQIIEFSELGSFIDNPVRTYSSGMYMRLAFSVAINVDAEILLIDEILAVGDQHFQDKCYAKLEELRDSEKTIVIVSHSLEVVRKLCNRAIWIYKGSVKDDGNPDEVIQDYLDQITEDNSAEDIKFVKKDKYEGMLYIDYPSSFLKINNQENKIIESKGWELSETIYSYVKVSIDDADGIKCERNERKDVFNVYDKEFGGHSLNKMPGWHCKLNIANLTAGLHTLKAVSYDENNNLINKKEVTFTIE